MRIELDQAIETVEELLASLRELNGQEPDQTKSREGRRQRVEVNRALMRMAHLADRARVQVLDSYYVYKDQETGAEFGEGE
jgi:hypothetical protein